MEKQGFGCIRVQVFADMGSYICNELECFQRQRCAQTGDLVVP